MDKVEDDISSFIDRGLKPNTNYEYMVKAYDVSGNKSISDKYMLTTSKDINAPTAPENLYLNSKTGWEVNISWKSSTDDSGISGYEIYKDNEKVGETTELSFTIKGLEQNKFINFR